MAYVSKANLSDKDIRAFQPQEKQYRKAVGHPSQLYIWVNPSGIKTLVLIHAVGEWRSHIRRVTK